MTMRTRMIILFHIPSAISLHREWYMVKLYYILRKRVMIMQTPFKCIAYIFCQSDDGLSKLRFDIVTHVNYAFAIPTGDGHVLPLERPDHARAVLREAHAHGAKVCISLGGWSYQDIPLESTFREATNTPEKVARLTDEIIALAEQYGFDGVDVDWEYPRVDDGSKEQYEALISLLHSRLKPKGMLLTAAILAGVDSNNAPITSATDAQDFPSFDKLDWVNLMTYDCDGPKHSTCEFARNSIEYWTNVRRFDPAKMTLGVPFYGKPLPGEYYLLLEADASAPDKDMVVLDGREVWYNGRETLKKKVALAKEYGLGGVMLWEISHDSPDPDTSLLVALGQAIGET